MKNLLAKGAMLAACLTITGGAIVPAPALADPAASAFLGAALGAVVGTLLFDSSSHRYYYVNQNRRYYVSNQQAQGWYQRQDPTYYRSHQSDFRNNPSRFASGWQGSHHGGHGH